MRELRRPPPPPTLGFDGDLVSERETAGRWGGGGRDNLDLDTDGDGSDTRDGEEVKEVLLLSPPIPCVLSSSRGTTSKDVVDLGSSGSLTPESIDTREAVVAVVVPREGVGVVGRALVLLVVPREREMAAPSPFPPSFLLEGWNT